MLIRDTFPKVRKLIDNKTGNPLWQVDARSKKWGMNERPTFSTESEALGKARQIWDGIKQHGATPQIPKEQLAYVKAYKSLVERLTPFAKTPEDAVEHYVKYLGDEIIRQTMPTIGQLIEQWQSHKLMDKSLDDAYRNEIKLHCRYIKRTWGDLKPNEVRKNGIETTLLKKQGTNNTRKKYLTFIRMFFNWVLAEDKGYITTNPAMGIKFKAEKFEKEFYSPEQLKDFLNNIATNHKNLLGYYTLLTFAGLRPSEGARVEWHHVNFTTKELHVIKGKTDARHVHLEPVAIEWLKYHKEHSPKDAPFVPQRNLFNLEREARGTMEKWIADGLRHGFATNYASLKKDYPAVAWYMGNSVAMIKKHYARTIPKDQLKAFWGLMPSIVIQ